MRSLTLRHPRNAAFPQSFAPPCLPGVLVAEAWSRCTDVIEIMQSMAEITAGRGGQSAGVVTYLPSSNGGSTGVRVRVRLRACARARARADCMRRALMWDRVPRPDCIAARGPASTLTPARFPAVHAGYAVRRQCACGRTCV